MRTWNITLPDADLNQDGKVTWDELLRSTGYIIALIALALSALALGVWLLVPYPLGRVLAGIVVVSIVSGSIIGLWRQLRYERAERMEREELRRRREREDHEFDVVRGATTTEANTHWSAALQDQAARLWLRLSYERGKPITRAEWQQLGQPVEAWNRINGLMNKRKIRRGSDLAFETLAAAWGAWCDAEMKSREWIRAGDTEFVKD